MNNKQDKTRSNVETYVNLLMPTRFLPSLTQFCVFYYSVKPCCKDPAVVSWHHSFKFLYVLLLEAEEPGHFSPEPKPPAAPPPPSASPPT